MKLLDDKLGLLREKLKKTKATDNINLIVLSDHGMTQVDLNRLILLYEILEEIDVKTSGSGPLVQFFAEDKWERKKLYNYLKENEHGFKVYLKEDFPQRYSYNKNPFIGDIIALADLHNTFILSAEKHERVKKWKSRGDHGYDNYAMDMHGIFIASGPAFKEGYHCGTLQNIDVYPLVCEILGIVPNQKIDGKLERIKAVLK